MENKEGLKELLIANAMNCAEKVRKELIQLDKQSDSTEAQLKAYEDTIKALVDAFVDGVIPKDVYIDGIKNVQKVTEEYLKAVINE